MEQFSDFVYAISWAGVKQQGAGREDDMVVQRYTDAERCHFWTVPAV